VEIGGSEEAITADSLSEQSVTSSPTFCFGRKQSGASSGVFADSSRSLLESLDPFINRRAQFLDALLLRVHRSGLPALCERESPVC
jgi:hypothetical protein